MEAHCIFCAIASGKIGSNPILKTDDIIVIKDIAPKAPIHYLIIPNNHYRDLNELVNNGSLFLLQHLFSMPSKIAHELHKDIDYRLIVNTGPLAGQTVFHAHIHFLAGTPIEPF